MPPKGGERRGANKRKGQKVVDSGMAHPDPDGGGKRKSPNTESPRFRVPTLYHHPPKKSKKTARGF